MITSIGGDDKVPVPDTHVKHSLVLMGSRRPHSDAAHNVIQIKRRKNAYLHRKLSGLKPTPARGARSLRWEQLSRLWEQLIRRREQLIRRREQLIWGKVVRLSEKVVRLFGGNS